MPDTWIHRLEKELNQLRDRGRLRSLQIRSGIDFGSNDYLGFAEDAELKQQALAAMETMALSSSASRLLPGHHAEHLEAENYFASFVGAESALLFNSGYDANMALLTTLPTRHDLIFYDERSHASIYDGVHASLAKSRRFAHNASNDLRKILEHQERKGGQIFVVLESVYSMDGDIAHLEEIAGAAKKHDAILIVDEAHATGVLGERGEGLVTSTIGRANNVISVHTGGKALGAAGALVVGNRIVTQYLVNKARPFIYTTALPPVVPVQLMNAIRQLESNGAMLVERLRERSILARERLRTQLARWNVPEGITPIISIIIGSDNDAVRASRILEKKGFIVPAVRPPTVPEGTARLRLNISLRHSEEKLSTLIHSICEAEGEMA